MSMNKPDMDQIKRTVETSMRPHWNLCLIEGVILIILGLAALFMPRSLAVDSLFGWLFLISGIVGLGTTFWAGQTPGCWWSLVSGVLGIVAGILLLLSPRGVLSLTLILIVFFIIEGIASIMFALDHKRNQSGQWTWMLVSGVVDLCLSAFIVIGLPGSAQWALGLLIGVNLMTGGVALVAMALHARKSAPAN